MGPFKRSPPAAGALLQAALFSRCFTIAWPSCCLCHSLLTQESRCFGTSTILRVSVFQNAFCDKFFKEITIFFLYINGFVALFHKLECIVVFPLKEYCCKWLLGKDYCNKNIQNKKLQRPELAPTAQLRMLHLTNIQDERLCFALTIRVGISGALFFFSFFFLRNWVQKKSVNVQTEQWDRKNLCKAKLFQPSSWRFRFISKSHFWNSIVSLPMSTRPVTAISKTHWKDCSHILSALFLKPAFILLRTGL